MNIALWVVQGLLAVAFLGAGMLKLVKQRTWIAAQPQLGWAGDFSDGQVKGIGVAEVLGALGLVLPWGLGIDPVLTPIAAAGLAIVMAGAVATHRRRGESIVPPALLGVLCMVVAVSRFMQLSGTGR